MFDASFMELMVVFVIGLLILGPERLPRVAAQLGRWIGKARRTATQLRYQLEREVALEEIYKDQGRRKRPASPPSNPRAHESAGSTPSADGASASGAGADAPTADAPPAAAAAADAPTADAPPADAPATHAPPADAPATHAPPADATAVVDEAAAVAGDAPPESSERKSGTG